MKTILSILGSAQDGGVPQPGCYCNHCKQAMRNPTFRRTAASLALILPEEDRWHLIDCTPDFKEQLIRVQTSHHLKGKIMDSIFLTHAHMGHYPGISFLGKEAMNTHRLPVHVGDEMAHMLKNNAPWQKLIEDHNMSLQPLHHQTLHRINEHISIWPILVPHRNEFSETFGFWIEGKNKKVLYIPDIDSWEGWDMNVMDRCSEADICILDGTFHSADDLSHIKRDINQIPHPFMTTTMQRLERFAKNGETDIYFTHINHSNPVLNTNSPERVNLENRGFKIAYDGMEFLI